MCVAHCVNMTRLCTHATTHGVEFVGSTSNRRCHNVDPVCGVYTGVIIHQFTGVVSSVSCDFFERVVVVVAVVVVVVVVVVVLLVVVGLLLLFWFVWWWCVVVVVVGAVVVVAGKCR